MKVTFETQGQTHLAVSFPYKWGSIFVKGNSSGNNLYCVISKIKFLDIISRVFLFTLWKVSPFYRSTKLEQPDRIP